jgi:class 3 adenylate cyclase
MRLSSESSRTPCGGKLTELLAQGGDEIWRHRLDEYRATVRRDLRRYGGVEMHIAGDSFFAAFTDPLRAVRCAQSLAQSLQALGLPSRLASTGASAKCEAPK